MAKLVQQRFSGKDRSDAIRLARTFWSEQVAPLGVTWDAFFARCVSVGRGNTIVVVECELQRTTPA